MLGRFWVRKWCRGFCTTASPDVSRNTPPAGCRLMHQLDRADDLDAVRVHRKRQVLDDAVDDVAAEPGRGRAATSPTGDSSAVTTSRMCWRRAGPAWWLRSPIALTSNAGRTCRATTAGGGASAIRVGRARAAPSRPCAAPSGSHPAAREPAHRAPPGRAIWPSDVAALARTAGFASLPSARIKHWNRVRLAAGGPAPAPRRRARGTTGRGAATARRPRYGRAARAPSRRGASKIVDDR